MNTILLRGWILLALVSLAATTEEIRLYRAAEAMFADKLYDVAERQLGEFLQKFPNCSRADRAQLLMGQAQLQRGNWQAAVATLQTGLTRWPEKTPDSFRFWLAEALTQGGQFAEAEKAYREVVEKFPRSEHRLLATYGLSFAQFKQGQFDAAIATLDRLLKPEPGVLSSKVVPPLETELLRGQIELARGRVDPAEATLKSLIQKAPFSLPAYQARLWLGESFARRQQFDAATNQFRAVTEAFQSKPNQPVDASLAADAWYNLGWTCWQHNQFAEATDAFAQTLVHSANPVLRRNALIKLSEASVRAGKVADGVVRLKEFVQSHPTDPLAEPAQMSVADLLYGQGDLAAAQAEYARFMAQYPKSGQLAKANANAGWCAWKNGQLADSARFFEQAVALATEPVLVADSLFKLADAQFALGQHTNAIASYQRLIESRADLPALDRALFQLAQAQARTGNDDGAATTFNSLAQRFPNSEFAAEARYRTGQIAVSRGREEAARTSFAVTVSQHAGTPWAMEAALAIGESFYREGKYDTAIASFNAIMAGGLATEPAQRAFYQRGLCLAKKNQADKTLAEFTDFLAKQPTAPLAPEIQFWVANYYLQQKDYLKAQEQFQSLAKNYPGSSLADVAQYYAGRTAYLRQDYKGAIELFETVLNTFSNSTWCADARFGEGDALSELGQFEDALVVFGNLIKQFPNHPLATEAYGRKGDCQFTLNRYEEAIASYRKSLDTARDTSTRHQALFKAGQCHEKLNQLDDAIQFYTRTLYETAAVPEPNEPPERFWACKAARAAATLKEQQKQWRDAITLYQKLGEICPDLKTVAEDRIRRIRVENAILF